MAKKRYSPEQIIQSLREVEIHTSEGKTIAQSVHHIRSDNGPEFTAKVVRRWLEKFEMKNLFIEPSSSWENDYNESFNGKLTDE